MIIFHIYEEGTAGSQLDKRNFDEELKLVRVIPGRVYDEKRRLWIVPQSADLPGLKAAIKDSKRQLSFLSATQSSVLKVDEKLFMRSAHTR